jgi:acyl carrier protein phosphodiesterase
MGAVKILDFIVDQKESFKQMLHDELDNWIDGIEDVFDTDKQPTVMELSELFTETRQKFLGNCLQILIEHKYSEQLHQEFCNCPKCGALCKKRRDDQKQITTMQGQSVIIRPWFYCTNCLHGFHPIDQVLEISRKENQFDVQKQSVKLSGKLPFADASETFSDLTGLNISDHFIHDTYEDVGSEAKIEDVIPSRDEMVQRIKEASVANWRPILVVASDGAHLPTREKAKRNERRGKGKWKEAKGFRIYLLSHERIIHLASWHQIQGEEQFGKDLAFVAARIPQDMVRISLLGDGADWLWKHMTVQFPKGREILDYYHCSEHIHKVAKVQYGVAPFPDSEKKRI